MQFQVKGRNLEVSDAIRSYAEQKLAKLDRQLNDPRVELELAVERNPSIAANQIAGTDTSSRDGYRSAVNAPPKTQPVSMQMVLLIHSARGVGVWPYTTVALPR